MPTIAPVSYSIARHGPRDVEVVVRFAPTDPIGQTEVLVADTPPAADMLPLLDAAAERLRVYAREYRRACADDV